MTLNDYSPNQILVKNKYFLILQERLRHELKGPEIRRSNSTSNASKGGGKSKQQQLLLGAVKRKSGGETNNTSNQVNHSAIETYC